jgi:hypothetical protein
MEKFYNAVGWIRVGIVVIFFVSVALFRAAAFAWLTVWMARTQLKHAARISK